MTQNRLLKRLSVCLLAIATLTCAKAQTEQSIYVSPKGNDRAEGNLQHPLRSIQAAIEQANRTEKTSLSQSFCVPGAMSKNKPSK